MHIEIIEVDQQGQLRELYIEAIKSDTKVNNLLARARTATMLAEYTL